MYTCPPERPERMYWAGRSIIAEFAPDEQLYIRYLGLHWVDGQLDHTGVPFPRMDRTSVNRGSLSEPEDDLFSPTGEYASMGVLEFLVKEIPSSLQAPDIPSYIFWPKHVPLDLNYSHSEIWSKRSESDEEFRKPSPSVKTIFRIRLAQVLTTERICILADDSPEYRGRAFGPAY